jgi:two-component system, OmpR family, sensor kinase
MSLRERLLVVVLALVVAGLLGSDIATFSALRQFLLRRVDQELLAERLPLERGLSATKGDPALLTRPARGRLIAGGAFIELRDPQGKVLAQSDRLEPSLAVPRLPVPLPAPPPVTAKAGPNRGASTFTTGSVRAGGAQYRVSVSAVAGVPGVLVVAIPLRDLTDTLHRLLVIEAVVTGLAVAGSLAAGLWLVRVGLRPLDDIGETAGAITAGDLTRRVPVRGTRTEVAKLGRAFNTMVTQIEGAFAERQESENRLRRFVADASHELRTPLTSIRGYAELFRRGADHRPEDLAKVLNRIEEESARMGILVDELLLLARLDQGRPLARHPTNLGDIAEAAVDAAAAVDPERDWLLDAPAPLFVMGDADRLRQLVDNLLANVRAHTPPRSPAEIRLTEVGTNVVLEVVDHGPGMRPDVAAQAFERFYRADAARTRAGGVGLGLSIVAAIAAAHGGRASVISAPGEGATFRIELPRSGEESSLGTRPAMAAR